MTLSSAGEIISLLDEPNQEVQVFAIKRLNKLVDEYWTEMSEIVEKIVMLHENESFSHRKLAALLASKIYLHLGVYKDSIKYALEADELFNINEKSYYVETITGKIIDSYIKMKQALFNGSIEIIDTRLETIVTSLFQRCFDDGQYRQSLGMALDARRIDMFENSIMKSDDVSGEFNFMLNIIN